MVRQFAIINGSKGTLLQFMTFWTRVLGNFSLITNDFTITDAIRFSEEIRNSPIGEDDILVSYDVTALFTNVPLNETTSFPGSLLFTPRKRERRDPGWGWSRVSQNMGDYK